MLIFLHILKTGGTSLRWALSQKFAPKNVVECYQATGCSFERDIVSMPEASKRSIRLFVSHRSYGVHQIFPQQTTYVTILRHPDERVISEYYQLHAIERVNISLERFVNNLPDYHADNGLVRALCGKGRSGEVTVRDLEIAQLNLAHHITVFGFLEHYRQSLALIAKVMGWQSISEVQRNPRPPQTSFNDVAVSQRKRIAMLNHYDHALYEYGVKRFQSLLEAHEITDEFVRKTVKRGVRTDLALLVTRLKHRLGRRQFVR